MYSEKHVFGKNDDRFHLRNTDFEVMARTSGHNTPKKQWK